MPKTNTPLPYQAYSRASLTVAKTRQVVMLYDGVIRNLMQAQDAMANQRPERRFEKMMKASEIVLALQSSLALDAKGDIAQTLFDYYSQLDAQIVQLLNSEDATQLEPLLDDLRHMRAEWEKIDQDQAATIAPQNPEAGQEVSA